MDLFMVNVCFDNWGYTFNFRLEGGSLKNGRALTLQENYVIGKKSLFPPKPFFCKGLSSWHC